MDWTHLMAAFWGGSFTLLFAYGMYRITFEREARGSVPSEEEPVDEKEVDQIDRAFAALDAQDDQPGDMRNNVFPLPPKPQAVEPIKPKAEHKIIKVAAGHPCRFLDLTAPPQFRAGECQGLCRHPGQNGRICHWAPAVAKQCGYFDPKVRPRVKLRRAEA